MNLRGVTEVTVNGYSYGGSATYNLTNRIARNLLPIGASSRLTDITALFTIPFTSYVDAITQDSTGIVNAENRRPPSSGFHLNLYQTNGPLDGGPVVCEENVDVTPFAWAAGITHLTIDDYNNVRDWVKMRLRQRVTR